MKAGLETVSGDLRHRGRSLLDQYEEEDLHQLRVGLRRMRSYLKSRSGSRAKHLRHELGKLADATHAARDWDTLIERAYAQLGPRQVKLFEIELRRRQADAHRPVLQMLDSAQWTAAMDSWDKYLGKHHPRSRGSGKGGSRKGGSGKGGKSIQDLRARVDFAWRRANQVGEPRNWHRLRIVIKDLRYRLEEQPGKPGSADRSQMIRQCKQLQTCLGDWHDTVVHLQLVRELAHKYDPGSASRELKVLRNWCRVMENQGRQCLEATRACLESPDDIILPDRPGQAPQGGAG